MSVSHLDVFFGKVSIHVFCPFLNWVICFLGVEFDKFFVDFGYSLFIRYVCKYLLPFHRLHFSVVDFFLTKQERISNGTKTVSSKNGIGKTERQYAED